MYDPPHLSQNDLIEAIETRPGGRASLDLHFLRTPNPSVFFLFVEKVACTSVKQSLFTAFYGDLYSLDPEYFFAGWRHHDILHAFSYEALRVDGRDVLKSTSNKIITFCRNPYSRFVSAFVNRVAEPRGPDLPFAQWVRREVLYNGARNGQYRNAIGALSEGVKLKDFARFVRDSPVDTYDVHWMPQHFLNLADVLPLTATVRFENFQDEFKQAWETHVGTAFPALTKQERNPSRKLLHQLDEETAALISSIYEADFAIFNYARESWAE